MNKNDVIKSLKKGGVGVLPTDTLYGLLGSALNKKTVERIYKLRKRDLDKPMIILIERLKDLEFFGIEINKPTIKLLHKLWPGKVSVILPCDSPKFKYLHRGTKSLAFRLPKNNFVTAILKETGPLVAPSANTQGKEPALTINEAKTYFGAKADFYFDKGKLVSKPSTLVQVSGKKVAILRPGSFPSAKLRSIAKRSGLVYNK